MQQARYLIKKLEYMKKVKEAFWKNYFSHGLKIKFPDLSLMGNYIYLLIIYYLLFIRFNAIIFIHFEEF